MPRTDPPGLGRGERDPTERELPQLEVAAPGAGPDGQRGLQTTPARRLRQLLSAVNRMSDHLFDDTQRVGPQSDSGQWETPTDLEPAARKFLVQLADTAARRWQGKDRGIWENQGEPRDFLDSKLMCWVTLDRAVIQADRLNASSRIGS